MKIPAVLWSPFFSILICGSRQSESISWDKLINSKSYENTRLVIETENPFQSLNISKETSVATTQIICSMFCANNATCLGFNFYSTSNQYVCEFLPENFCSNRQRIALQIWPGGRVWDKLRPGMKKACIDQQFENRSTTNYCEIGHSGCRNSKNTSSTAWAGCDNCIKTCVDVAHNCTLWPGGPSHSPIFAFCLGNAMYAIKRGIDLVTGRVWPDYQMNLLDLHRISKLGVYSTMSVYLKGNVASYNPKYKNFYIDENGTLSNMTYVSSAHADGFYVGNTPLKPAPWITGNSTCGDFWLLNSSFSTATLQCPGGEISFFGAVNTNASPKQTGIRWPPATAQNNTLEYLDVKIDV